MATKEAKQSRKQNQLKRKGLARDRRLFGRRIVKEGGITAREKMTVEGCTAGRENIYWSLKEYKPTGGCVLAGIKPAGAKADQQQT